MSWYIYLTRKGLTVRNSGEMLDYLILKAKALPIGLSTIDYGWIYIQVKVNDDSTLTVDFKSVSGELSNVCIYLAIVNLKRELVGLKEIVEKMHINSATFSANDEPILFISRYEFVWWIRWFDGEPSIYEIPEV